MSTEQGNAEQVFQGYNVDQLLEYVGRKGNTRRSKEELKSLAVAKYTREHAIVELQNADEAAAEADEAMADQVDEGNAYVEQHPEEFAPDQAKSIVIVPSQEALDAYQQSKFSNEPTKQIDLTPTDEDEETQSDVQPPNPTWYDPSNPFHDEILRGLREGMLNEQEAAELAAPKQEEVKKPKLVIPEALRKPERPKLAQVVGNRLQINFVTHNPANDKKELPKETKAQKQERVATARTKAQDENIGRVRNRRYSDNDVRGMFALREAGTSLQKLSKHFDCSTTFLTNIYKRNTYADVDLSFHAYDASIPVGVDAPWDLPAPPTIINQEDAARAAQAASEQEAERRAEMRAEDEITGFDRSDD